MSHILAEKSAGYETKGRTPLRPAVLGNTPTTYGSDVYAGQWDVDADTLLAQSALWAYASRKKLRQCHRVAAPGVKEVAFDERGRAVNLANSEARISPLGSRKLYADDSLSALAAVEAWLRADIRHDVGLLTVTIPHRIGDGLEELLGVLQQAWNRLTRASRGDFWERFSRKYGVEAWEWHAELTYGKNGHHPHRHALLFFSEKVSREALVEMRRELHEAWGRVVYAVMGKRISLHGTDLVVASKGRGGSMIARYVTKGMVMEAAGAANKRARGKGRNPHQVLLSLAKRPIPADIALWHEIEAATLGMRWVGRSGSFAELMEGVGIDAVKAELKAALDGGLILFAVPGDEWTTHLSRRVDRRRELMEVVKSAGEDMRARYEAARELLAGWGVSCRPIMQVRDDWELLRPSAGNCEGVALEAWEPLMAHVPVGCSS